MWKSVERPSVEAVTLRGDARELAAQLGSPAGLGELAPAPVLLAAGVSDLAGLQRFLRDYRTRVLAPVELPAIQRAFVHASRYELRELIALDQELAQTPGRQAFAAASQAVGRAQLRRLRPLRDQRLARRYLQAVERGQAHGWHTLVYGLILSLFSLPLRQGLENYGRQTMHSFIGSAARPLELSEVDCRVLLEEITADLPQEVERALGDSALPRLLAL
jgi:urease accessory protein UreF